MARRLFLHKPKVYHHTVLFNKDILAAYPVQDIRNNVCHIRSTKSNVIQAYTTMYSQNLSWSTAKELEMASKNIQIHIFGRVHPISNREVLYYGHFQQKRVVQTKTTDITSAFSNLCRNDQASAFDIQKLLKACSFLTSWLTVVF